MKPTNEEIRLCRKQLERWHRPLEMHHLCDDLVHRMGNSDVFGKAGFRNAWAAASFAEHRGADAIRLVPAYEQCPDFELQFGSRKEQWEFTEAGEPDRGCGIEHVGSERYLAAAERGFGDDPVSTWIKRAETAPDVIRANCAAKADKHYSGWVRLLVYLNIQEYGIRQREVEASFPDATAPAKDAFSEVWVFWKERAYCIWKDGRLVLQSGVGSPNPGRQLVQMSL